MAGPGVERFEAKAHFEMLKQWWRGHGQNPPPLEALPQSGFVVQDLAAGFLYRTDSTLAMVEWLISNPHSEASQRRPALDQVCVALVEEARTLGFKLLTASTKDAVVVRRAEAYGMAALPGAYTILGRVL